MRRARKHADVSDDGPLLNKPSREYSHSQASYTWSGLQREAPEIDYEEWKRHLSTTELEKATALLQEIAQCIAASRQGKIGGHWSRHERRHGRLNAAFPNSPWAKAVRDGLRYFPTRIPPQHDLPNPKLEERDRHLRVLMVRKWLRDGVIRPISREHHRDSKRGERRLFYSHLFLVEKNGKVGDYYAVDVDNVDKFWRGCLNEKPLNPFLLRGHFKQSGDMELQAKLQPTTAAGGTYVTSTDVQSAFTTILLSEEPLEQPGMWSAGVGTPWGKTSSVDLGCFDTHDPEFAEEAPYGWQVLVGMFGFAPMPYNWQKCYSLPRTQWTKDGARATVTIMDDNAIAESHMHSKAKAILSCLQSLLIVAKVHVRFMIPLSPKDKSAIYPSTVRVFGGVLIDTVLQRLWVAEEKRQSILRSVRNLYRSYKNKSKVSAKQIASAVGKIGAATSMLFGVRLFTNQLQRALHRILGGEQQFSRTGYLHKLAGDQLEHLLQGALKNFNGKMMIHGKRVDHKVVSDFSGVGHGAVLQPSAAHPRPPVLSIKLSRPWRRVWSGAGETMAGGWAVKAYATHYQWHDCIVLLVLDNVAAICYFNHWGHASDEEINVCMRPFWEFCRRQGIYVIATFCPGAIIVADEPSRRMATVWEYFLQTRVFRMLERWLMGSTGSITFDLFASHANTQTPKFASLNPDPECQWVDCLKHPWGQQQENYYAFPPPNVMAVVLSKVVTEEQTVMLVAPAWTKQHAKLISQLLIAAPLIVPWTKETVLNPHEGRYRTEEAPQDTNWERWLLVGYLISGDTQRLSESRPQLRKSTLASWRAQQPILQRFTPSGSITAKAMKWIQFMHELMQSLDA